MGEKLKALAEIINEKADIPTIARNRVNLKVGKPVATIPDRFSDEEYFPYALRATAEVLEISVSELEDILMRKLGSSVAQRGIAGAGKFSSGAGLSHSIPQRENITSGTINQPQFKGLSMFSWKPEYSVGVSIIDEQHKKLIELLQKLSAALRDRKGDDILHAVLSELEQYIIIHFGTEERLMSQYSYPNFPAHKKEHDSFVRKVDELKAEYQQGGGVSVAIRMFSFLRDWLYQHILRTDKELGSFLNQKGVR